MNQAIEQLESDLKAENEDIKQAGEMFSGSDLFVYDQAAIDKRLKEIEEAERLKRQALLKESVRHEWMQPIDRSVKTVDWAAFDKIQTWDGKKGITARGVSNLGKTRAIMEVLKREFVENSRQFTVLCEYQVLAQISSAMMAGKLEKLTQRWIASDILFFDDIDKVNFSSGVTGENAMTIVYGVIKARDEMRRPTILAYNLSLSEIFKKAGDHVLESLKRRVTDKNFWMNVEFKEVL